jgi:hypothetical protein
MKPCSTLRVRKWRENNPLRYAYQTTKDNAKRRGKEFDLSFNEFKEFAIRVDYIKKKGIHASSIHIDRIEEEKGYTVNNIQPLENSQNVRKYLDYRWSELDRQMDFDVVTVKYGKLEGVPF